jgi:hypothetical protein
VTATIFVPVVSTVNDLAVFPITTASAVVKFEPEMVTDVVPFVEPEMGAKAVIVGAGMAVVTKMNEDDDVAVPPGVVTLTNTGPAVWFTVVNVICVPPVVTVNVTSVPPTVTEVAPVKLVPVMVTEVVPLVDPVVGVKLVIVGAGTTNL